MASEDAGDFEIVAPVNSTFDSKINEDDEPTLIEEENAKELCHASEHYPRLNIIARSLLIFSLPFILFGSALGALSKTHQLSKTSRAAKNEQILEYFSSNLQHIIHRTRVRLQWVDEHLPSAFEKHRYNPILKSGDIIGDTNWGPLADGLANVLHYTIMALAVILAHWILPALFPFLRSTVRFYVQVPVWVPGALAYCFLATWWIWLHERAMVSPGKVD